MQIYVVSDPDTEEPRYIGKTARGARVRFNEHMSLARSVGGDGAYQYKTHLYCWLRSLSKPPLLEVAEECLTVEKLNEAERFYISYFRSLGFRLVNHSDGGEGQTGFRFSPEQRVRLSIAQRGIKKPGVGLALRGRPNLGTRGRVQTREERLKKSKPIVDQNGVVYPGINYAAAQLGVHARAIAYVLKGEWTQTHGFTFKYQTQSLV